MKMHPFIFEPRFKDRVWGGHELFHLYQKCIPHDGPTGESWEISDRPGDESVVRNGPMAGKSLRWLMENRPAELLGKARPTPEGRFPLLCKILDARDKLSLQVHPPKSKAVELGGEPKTEMWYIAHAAPNAELYAGLKNGVTKSEFERKIADGTVADCFHRIAVTQGDTLFLPSGRVHAIGAGLVIFEIQQNSDTTYRVFDWNRKGLDGRPRDLHIPESLASIDFGDFEPKLVSTTVKKHGQIQVRELVRDPLFDVHLWRFPAQATHPTPDCGMQILAVTSGAMTVQYAHGREQLRKGDFCLLPSCLGESSITTEEPAECLWVSAH